MFQTTFYVVAIGANSKCIWIWPNSFWILFWHYNQGLMPGLSCG